LQKAKLSFPNNNNKRSSHVLFFYIPVCVCGKAETAMATRTCLWPRKVAKQNGDQRKTTAPKSSGKNGQEKSEKK